MNISHTKLIYGAMLLAAVFLTACGGGGGGGGGTTTPPATTYTIGGTVSGLTGTGLVLQNNGGNNLSISANGSFTFTTALANSTAYAVTVLTQPAGQVCTATNNTGTVSGANVTTVSVTCSSSTHTIGGTISGLTGTVVLQNNGGDNLTISTAGTSSFTFATPVAHSAAYAVTVFTQPAGQRCTVTGGTGIASADVTNVTVSCKAVYTVSAAVSGIGTSIGLKLQNTGSVTGTDLLSINAGAGTYPFSKGIATGETYSVKVFIQPAAPALTCTSTASATPASGTMPPSAITVNIACGPPVPRYAYVANGNDNTVSAYTIGGTGTLTRVVCGPLGTPGCDSVNGNDFLAGTNPQSVTVDPSGKFAYAANFNSNDISAYKITAGTGALTVISCSGGAALCNGAAPYNRFKAGTSPQSVTVDSSGRFAYVANVTSSIPNNRILGDISAYTINQTTGVLTQINCGGGAACDTATGKNFLAGWAPSSVTIDHNGQFAYVANANDDSISAYSIDQTTGALARVVCGLPSTPACEPLDGKDFLAGAAPRSLDIDPTSQFVYAVNATTMALGSAVSAYTINPSTGALTQINCGGGAGCNGANFLVGADYPESLAVDASGKFLYVANNGAPPAAGSVSAFTINTTTGALTQINCGGGATCDPAPGKNFAAGVGPISVTSDLSGQYVYVANFGVAAPPYDVSAYLITAVTGVLTPINCGGGAGCNGANYLAGAKPTSVITTVTY